MTSTQGSKSTVYVQPHEVRRRHDLQRSEASSNSAQDNKDLLKKSKATLTSLKRPEEK